jgi:hypothetical protein
VNVKRWLKLLCALALGALLLGACAGSPGGNFVWIDVPLDGLTFPDVQAIKIEGHATGSGGVARVEIWIDGALLTTITDPPVEGVLANFHTEWTPSAPGEYTIQAVAYGSDGSASQPDSARITFGGEIATLVAGCPTPVGGGPTPVSCPTLVEACPSPVGGGPTPVSCAPVDSGCPTPVGGGPTPVSCPTLVITVTPAITDTPTSLPGAVIQFWAEPPEIAAGACTTIRWHAENVQSVVFGGLDQPFDGSYGDCLCGNQRYTLTVTHLDGTEEKRTVDISVTGSCDTPTVPPPEPEEVDTTPPAAPSPAVPDNGLTLSCRGSQNLAWLPVEDKSGIAEYQVEVQRHSGDNNWQAAPGGSISVADKTTSIPVECGWYYRWRVRAIDGAGNASGWSGWSQFTITLS